MKKILLLGEHCLDIYHYGKCNRLNPEAPVQILDQESEKRLEGMSSNVKNNLISFEFKVDHFKNKEHLEKHRLIDTTYKQHLIRYDIGDLPVREFNLDNLKDTYDYVVISDYNKGFITPSVADYICKKYKDIPVFVDSKKTDLSCFSNCIIKINKTEFNNLKDKNTKGNKLIVTLGEEGAQYEGKLYKTKKVEVYDVCGAGDVFLSSIVFGFAKYGSIERSIELANIFASFSVNKLGTYVLSKGDIKQLQYESL
tara:strand:+ start:1150 stop:1911 length:762 start_codon:yes stop_codon:yes gene_type:complete